MGPKESLLSKNKEVIHPHCQMRIWHKITLATSCQLVKQLGLNSEGANKMHISSKTPEHFGCTLYSGHPHTAQEMSAQPIAQRQVMSQYHMSPHLKEEGGRVSGGGAVGPG